MGNSLAGAITSGPGALEGELADPLGLNPRGIEHVSNAHEVILSIHLFIHLA